MRRLLSLFALAISLVVLSGNSRAIARPATGYPSGYDISFPQCHHRFPAPGAFAIVGVNGGMAGTWNRCLKHELSWAARSSGAGVQPAVELYVNTENPGARNSRWPTNNADPISRYPVADRYGKCAGGNTAACAWQYGWNTAEIDAMRRGIKAPLNYAWWLDVETTNSWESNRQLNRADLTGMADYFQSLGVPVGIYSTWLQWPKIAGTVDTSNPLFKLPEWVSGSSSRQDARSFCLQGAFMAGGPVVLSQWYSASTPFDADVACPGSGFRKLRNPY